MYVPERPEPRHPGRLNSALPDRQYSQDDESSCEQDLGNLKEKKRICQGRGKQWWGPEQAGGHEDHVEIQDTRNTDREDPPRASHQAESKPGNDRCSCAIHRGHASLLYRHKMTGQGHEPRQARNQAPPQSARWMHY